MKQRRTRIIRPQPGNGAALSQPVLIGQSLGHSQRQVWKGRKAGISFLSGKLEGGGGEHGGCGGGAFSTEHKFQGLRSSITPAAWALAHPPQCSSRGLATMQICCLQPSQGSPLSTGESPNSRAHLHTLPCAGPCLYHLHSPPAIPPPHPTHSPHFTHSDALVTLSSPLFHVANS